MKRVLCIVGIMNAGGAETFLMKILRNVNREEVILDFCVSKAEKGFYDDEILSLGSKILYTTPKALGVVKSLKNIYSIVQENDYKYVLRVSQHSLSVLELIMAKLAGAKCTMFRSSNTNTGGGRMNAIMHKLFVPLVKHFPNVRIAPSKAAAKFMFGTTENVCILRNGLELDKYSFSTENREKWRKELGVEDKYVIGHIGRFTHQKNHEYLIDIFSKLDNREDAVLMLIGVGETMEQIRNKVKEHGIEKKVLFLGVKDNVHELLSAMDLFLFPSLYEGMPNTVLEAQTNGLPCLVSDSITKEVAVTPYVKFISLAFSPETWCEEIISCKKYQDISCRKNGVGYMKEAGYDIKLCAKEFEKLCI